MATFPMNFFLSSPRPQQLKYSVRINGVYVLSGLNFEKVYYGLSFPRDKTDCP